MEWIAGRRKPHATTRAKTTVRENAEYLSEAERLVACFERIVDGNLDRGPQYAEAELREALATVQHRSRAITPSEVANVCAAWRTMLARWNELRVGEALRLEWRSARSRNKHRRP